jgi:hypothetical protein
MLEIKSGLNLTIAGPARVIVYGKPTLSGTQPEPQETTNDQSTPPATSHKTSPGSRNPTP